MLLETLSFLAVFIYALLRLERFMLARYLRQQANEALIAQAGAVARDRAVPTVKLMPIPGTRALPRRQHARLCRFGIRPERALELQVFESTRPCGEWPAGLRTLLQRLQESGNVRGPGVAAALAGPAGIAPGHALYFVLVDAANGATPEPIAFVDVTA